MRLYDGDGGAGGGDIELAISVSDTRPLGVAIEPLARAKYIFRRFSFLVVVGS